MAGNECYELNIDQAGLPSNEHWKAQGQQAAYYSFPQTELVLPMLQSCIEDVQSGWQSTQRVSQQSNMIDTTFQMHLAIGTTHESQQQFTQLQYSQQEPYFAGFPNVETHSEQLTCFDASSMMNGSSLFRSSPTILSQASPGSMPSTPSTTYSRLPASQLHSTTRFKEDDLRLGRPDSDGTWSCTFPTCTSEMRFTRGCDLRKHHKRHFKVERCRYPECQFSQNACFSSKKDRNRHEAGHRPGIPCAQGCGRLFSREDNMRDHIRRVHHRHKNT